MAIFTLIYIILFITALSYSFPKHTIMNNEYLSKVYIVFFSLISLYVVIITDEFYTDRSVYTSFFNQSTYLNFYNQFKNSDFEILYVLFSNTISFFTNEVTIFYIIFHIVFLIILIKGLSKINGVYFAGYSFFILLNSFFYYGYTLNGLRQGMAIAIIILTIGYILKNNNIKAFIAAISSILFHYSAIPIVVILLVLRYFKQIFKIRYLIIIYFLVSFLYIFDLQTLLVGFINIEYLAEYTDQNLINDFGETNNIKFLLFNTFFLSLFFLIYKNTLSKDEIFIFLYKCYIAFSIYFLMFGFIAFSNRIAVYSWFILPLIGAYYLNGSKNSLIKSTILIGILIIGLMTGVTQYFVGIE